MRGTQVKNRTRMAVSAIGASGALAAVFVLPAVADSATPADTAVTTQDDGDERDWGRGARHEAFVAALAEELDLDPEQVEAAVDAAHERLRDEFRAERLATLEERLDAAVADGRLTREQANEILEAHADGVMPLRGGAGHGWARGHHRGSAGPFGGGGGGPFGGWDADPDDAA
jgi:hypothetical protein